MKRIFFKIFFALCLLNVSRATTQVNIGALNDPQPFSLLELESNGALGFRLPQMNTIQRDNMVATAEFQAEKNGKARGLQIFNTTTKCVETWNGSKWIETCPPEGPYIPPISPSSESYSCGIEVDGTECVFTALDTKAEWYEFFLDDKSQGIQLGNSITFSSAVVDHNRVTAKYYYPLSFLKPKMIEVEGSSSWHYGDANNYAGTSTTKKIPDFKMSETEVTQAQYEYVMGTNPSQFQCDDAIYGQYVTSRPTSALPVEYVNWYDAITYCNKLSILEGKELCYSVKDASENEIDWEGSVTVPTSDNSKWNATYCDFSKNGYRLPTESEWEYAARGGVTEPSDHYIYSGDTDLCEVGWYKGNNYESSNTEYSDDCAKPCESVFGTKPVKTKTANKLGIYDMNGNVMEWTWSGRSDTFPLATPSNAVQASGIHRVLHGGYWKGTESNCSVSGRGYSLPSARIVGIGFRVACKGE